MALWMEAGSAPKSENEIADLQAISALKESAAIELKEKSNEYVKMGKKHYLDAIDCYTRAINQKALSNSENSILYSNRAHVNLLLGNHRRALQDAEEAIKLSPTNIKALYRAVKASLSLDLLNQAKSYCDRGLEQSPDNEELKKLAKQIDLKISEHEKHEAEVSKAVEGAKGLVDALEHRGLRIGRTMYQELTGLKKPILDKSNILHWPVLLLYAEVMSSDIIEDFSGTSCDPWLPNMFSDDCPPLSWDIEKAYTRDAIELYYEAGSGVCLSKKEIIQHLLEGTSASHLENFGSEDKEGAVAPVVRGTDSKWVKVNEKRTLHDVLKDPKMIIPGIPGTDSKWVKVNEKRTLHDVLKDPKMIIPGIPVFFIISRKSGFYKDFKSGNWAPPVIA